MMQCSATLQLLHDSYVSSSPHMHTSWFAALYLRWHNRVQAMLWCWSCLWLSGPAHLAQCCTGFTCCRHLNRSKKTFANESSHYAQRTSVGDASVPAHYLETCVRCHVSLCKIPLVQSPCPVMIHSGLSATLPCRARDLLQQQLDKLPSESTSQVIIALRQDLQQLLNGYQNRNTYFSSRHHGLSMASSHLTQRHTTHSSSGPVTVNPYSSSTQQMYSRRATNSTRSAAPQLQNPRAEFGIPTMPLPTSAPSGTNRAAGGNATPGLRERLISMQTQPYLPVAGENNQSGLEHPTMLTNSHPRHHRIVRAPADSSNDASSPHADPSFSQDWLHGAALQNPETRAVGRRRTSDRASIQRAPSNVSAAGQRS